MTIDGKALEAACQEFHNRDWMIPAETVRHAIEAYEDARGIRAEVKS